MSASILRVFLKKANLTKGQLFDFSEQLRRILTGEKVLDNAGSISHKQAVDKALDEYRKYQVLTLSPVEKAYLESIKLLEKKTRVKPKK